MPWHISHLALWLIRLWQMGSYFALDRVQIFLPKRKTFPAQSLGTGLFRKYSAQARLRSAIPTAGELLFITLLKIIISTTTVTIKQTAAQMKEEIK